MDEEVKVSLVGDDGHKRRWGLKNLLYRKEGRKLSINAKVTALMFSENPKEPALILASFRKESKTDKPVLKAAFINGDVYVGDNQLVALTNIKTKNELIGEVIGLLQSPAKRVLAALLNHHENGGETTATEEVVAEAPVAEVVVEAAAPVIEDVPVAEVAVEAAPEAPVAE